MVAKKPIEKVAPVIKVTKTPKPKIEPNSEVEELKDRIKQLEELMLKSLEVKAEPLPSPVVKIEENTEEIPFRNFIKVMSLTNNRLTLATEGTGKGTLYNFTEFGEIQPIMYEDLAKIIHNNQRFSREGMFYIMNPQVVKLHGLTKFYEKFASKEVILNIFDLQGNEMADLFKNTTVQIQETIVSIIVEKIRDGENVDLNRLQIISDIYGKDINAMARSTDSNV